jgi:hypothetical protein
MKKDAQNCILGKNMKYLLKSCNPHKNAFSPADPKILS